MRPASRATLLAAGWLLLCPAVRAQEAPVTFMDELGDGQVDEVIAVWSNGHLLGTLHVSPERPSDSFAVTLPPGPFTYSLCGMLRRRAAGGGITNHPVDNSGRVVVAPGTTLRAFTLDDRLFALEAPGTVPELDDHPACDAAIS